MSDWIMLDEALIRVRVRLGLIVATAPRELLIRAIRGGLVETHQGPEDPIAQATDSWIISAASLNAWIDGMLGIGPTVAAKAELKQAEPPKAASAQQAAAHRAVQELWEGSVPAGLTVDKRNAQIQQFARERGLAPPSDKTLQRFFNPLSKVARVGRS
jgi:hypothetical protein